MDNNSILSLYLNAHENLILKEVHEEKASKGVGMLLVDLQNIGRTKGWSCRTSSTYYALNDIPPALYTYKDQIADDPENNTSVYFLMNIEGDHTFYKRLQSS